MKKPQTNLQKAKADADEARVELTRKYRRVAATPDGHAVLEDIVNRICRYRQDVMTQNPMAVYDNATRRDVANAILKMTEVTE